MVGLCKGSTLYGLEQDLMKVQNGGRVDPDPSSLDLRNLPKGLPPSQAITPKKTALQIV